jgi:hypothetical protein
MGDKIVLYDVKLSLDIISDIEKNIITMSLINDKNPNPNPNPNDKKIDNKWYNNKCFFVSALLLSSTVIGIGLYVCFIFC